MTTKRYKDNHERIFGPKPEPVERTAEEQAIYERQRRETHKALVASGRKDAQYYVDNEVRVSSDPEYQPKPHTTNPKFKEGWERIYGKR